MNQMAKRRVFVANRDEDSVSQIDILRLLSEAEIDLSSVCFIENSSDDISFETIDALVITLFDEQTSDAIVEAIVMAAARAGSCNIVGVWAPGQEETHIHPTIVKFGTAQIPWAANKLKNELGSDCANVFQTPTGDDAEPNEVEPHECE